MTKQQQTGPAEGGGKRHITLRLTESALQRLEEHAAREERSLNQMIDFAVREYADKLDARDGKKG